MRLKKRLDSVELEQAKRNGDLYPKVVVILDGESENEALTRTGLTDSTVPVIFISEMDAKL